jgi:hypothetical protein
MHALLLSHFFGRISVLFLVLFGCALAQCSNVEYQSGAAFHNTAVDSTLKQTPPFLTYDSALSYSAQLRLLWSKKMTTTTSGEQPSILTNAGQALHYFLVDSIFPYWHGTTWDFNGYTNVPNQGAVACGYFVSTPLKHLGFNLNRYKLAQQYSHSIVNTLCQNVKTISGHQKFIEHMSTAVEGLYIVGLDNHVGFISKRKNKTTFIHSTYLQPSCVLEEGIEQSQALLYSNTFVLGNFSSNTAVIKKWLLNQTIAIVP